MKRMLVLVALLVVLGTSVGRVQTRVGVSLSFGDPYFAGQVVVGRPYFHRYRPAPVIVVAPRYYREPRVIVVRPYRFHRHRYHRGW